MKIGIDLDGVVIDSENVWRVYEEIFAIEDLNGRKLSAKEEPKYQDRYAWSKEEQELFNKKYLLKAAKECNLKPGFLEIYKKIRSLGYELVVITSRGILRDELKDEAIKLLEKNNIVFDKYYWKIADKLEICKKENVDVMIDDDYKIIKQLSKNNIKTLYFRDVNLKKLPHNEYIYEVNNWGDVYRYFKKN